MKHAIKLMFLILLFFIIPNFAYAANVYGNVYDLSLGKVNGARIEINTTPQQVFIAKEGSYSLQIPKGTYILKSESFEGNRVVAFEERAITVKEEGNYVIDFILFPSFEEEDSISESPDLDIPDTDENSVGVLIAIIIVFIAGALSVYYLYKRNKKELQEEKPEEEYLKSEESQEKYLDEVLKVIEEEDGRTTQKDIRKKIPLSEAKISLLIAELEHNGKIKKIKKGRGNIIILNK
jgi:uncharacterized membrane protein|tara:strand:- start:183 stop:890 length:708 start_codon:yes stop_codon:yes gene_type:complete